MTAGHSYVVITPVRNEEVHLPHTIASVSRQTLRPATWVLVNDGSTDGTARIADAAAQAHPWIKVVHRSDRGYRQPGGGVIEAFYDGYRLIEAAPWDFVVKLDADLAFSLDYFERCLRNFAENPKLGIGGGTICRLGTDGLTEESKGDPRFHVRGATKIYRRACWQQLGGLLRAPGWDTVDEVKANMLGWETRTFPELKLHQRKDTGSADGSWRNWVKNGRANYVTGYHPLFMVCKCALRAPRKPYLLAATALFWGFISGYLQRAPHVQDRGMIRYLRQQQLNRLLGRPSLWG
jgi:glycosyltransferase involved in cell wall biosynthesis